MPEENGLESLDLETVQDRHEKSSKSKHHKKEKHKHERKHKDKDKDKRHKERDRDKERRDSLQAEPPAARPAQPVEQEAQQVSLTQEPAAEAPAAVVGYESSAESGEIPEERQPVQAAEVQSSAQQQPVADAAPALRPDRDEDRKRDRPATHRSTSPPRKAHRSHSTERHHARPNKDTAGIDAAPTAARNSENDRHRPRPDNDRRHEHRGSSVASHRSARDRHDSHRDAHHRSSRDPSQRRDDPDRHRSDRSRDRPVRHVHDGRLPERGRGRDDHDIHRARHLSHPGRDSRDAGRYQRDRSRDRSRPERERERDRRPEREKEHDRRREREDQAAKQAEAEYAAKVVAELEADEEEDEDKLIEERRRRRAEIQRKHQEQERLAAAAAAPTSAEQQLHAAAQPPDSVPPQPPASPLLPGVPSSGQQLPQAGTPLSRVSSPSIAAFGSDGDEATHQQQAVDNADQLAGSESENEEMEIVGDMGHDFWQKGPGNLGVAQDVKDEPTPGASPTEQHHKLELQNRRIADLDIFADNVAEVLEQAKAAGTAEPARGANPALQDNYDDAEGYYNFQVGEVMDGRYEVRATHGRGVFSTVLLAKDRSQSNDSPLGMVAIKVIRAIDTMSKAARLETKILESLQSKGSGTGAKNCIRLLHTFIYRGHTCLVFEPMALNLRELVKKYGRNIGLNVKVVRIFAYQLLRALSHMRTCSVLHADIKPDNILTDASQRVVKICDFGSAMLAGDNEITPYLVSRFYRSPEVILGLKYDYPMDMWAIGCTIYELFKGEILFPGHSNNEMLSLMMDLKGPFPKKMLKKGMFSHNHFENDANMSFALQEIDRVTNHPVRRVIGNPTVKKSMADRIMDGEGERRKLRQLADLLDQMLQLDPDRRISIHSALKHPFIKEPFSD